MQTVLAGGGPGHSVTAQAGLPQDRSEHAPYSTKLAPLSSCFFRSFFTPFIYWQVSMETMGMGREREKDSERGQNLRKP